MLLFFRLPFVLLEALVRQGARGLGVLTRLLHRGEGGEPFPEGPGTTAPPGPGPRVASPGGPTTAAAAGAGVTDFEVALEEQGVEVVEDVVTDEDVPAQDAAAVAEVAETPEPPPPTAEEAIRRRFEREAVEQVAPPVEEPEPAPPLLPVEGDEHVDREPALVESFGPVEDPHGGLVVEVPWEGYDRMPAAEVVARLRESDEATKAVVRLYEQTHKRRQSVLRATA